VYLILNTCNYDDYIIDTSKGLNNGYDIIRVNYSMFYSIILVKTSKVETDIIIRT